MSRPARFLRRLDGILGRLVYRAFGLGLVALAVGTAIGVWNAVAAADAVGTLVMGGATAAFGALATYCFSRRRRLTDLG